jgi:DNA-binding beta-propeller fold protein YncE
VFFTDVSGGRLLILELRRLLENTDGFEPAAQVISVGAGPWDVALSPDETLAYVASRLGDNLHIVSTVTGEIIDSVDVGYSPISLHAGVGGGLLFVANRGSRSISVIDVSGLSNTGGVRGPLAVVDSISLSSVGGLTGTADGKLIVAAMPDHNAVAIVDTEGFSVRVVPVGDAPQTVVLGPDDRTAYVPNYASETISMIDVRWGRGRERGRRAGWEAPVRDPVARRGRRGPGAAREDSFAEPDDGRRHRSGISGV